MKKKLYSFTIVITIIILSINIFLKSSLLNNTIIFSINLFVKSIFPSLFPMFIISSLLTNIGIPELIGVIFKKPITKLFKTKSISSFILFMSMLSGFPSSAKYINDFIEKKEINTTEAEKILLFTFFSNPLFVINTIGNSFFGSKIIGFKIYLAHVLGSIITGIIFRNYNKNSTKELAIDKKDIFKNINKKIENSSIFKILTNSITESLNIMLNTFGIITCFLIVINISFGTPNNLIKVFIAGLIEMTSGLKYLALLNINQKIKVIISTFFISFGGLCIHTQIMNILKEKKVKYSPFLLSRIIHSLISIIIIYLILQMDILF